MTNVWALGDYDRISDLISDFGPALVTAADVRPGQRVLDVGAGTGNVAIPAAEAGADVVASDVTPELLAVGERKARELGLSLRWEVADATDLPYADGEFDVVLSAVGAMFAPDHRPTARELLRVCRPGGTIALANWVPDGAVAEFFGVLARYGAPPPDGQPPLAWGDPDYVADLLDGRVVSTRRRMLRVRFDGTPAEIAAYYRRHFGPVVATCASLSPDDAAKVERDLADLFATEDHGEGYQLEYLEVIARG